MLPLGMVIIWAGYGIASWGYVLMHGYNIPLRRWFSPLDPWVGDPSNAGQIPAGQIFPKGGAQNSQNAGAAGSNAGSGGTSKKTGGGGQNKKKG